MHRDGGLRRDNRRRSRKEQGAAALAHVVLRKTGAGEGSDPVDAAGASNAVVNVVVLVAALLTSAQRTDKMEECLTVRS